MKILHLSIIAVVCITLTTTLFLVMFVTTIPSNAIRTADGGWITPLKTFDEKGNALTMHYEVGKEVSGKLSPPPHTPSNDCNFKSKRMLMLPLQQLTICGNPPDGTICNTGFQLILKAEDGSPACVTPSVVNILIERGWGHLP